MKRRLLTLAAWILAAVLNASTAIFYGSELLGNSLITAITQTPDGMLWVGTENGLNRFDGYHFTPIRSLGEATSPRPAEVSVLYPAPSGHFWVGTARGLFLYDRSTDRFLPVEFPDSLSPRIATLTTQPDGVLAAGTAGYGIFYVDTLTLQARPQTGDIPDGNEAFVQPSDLTPLMRAMAPTGVVLSCAAPCEAGNTYIGTRGSGLLWIPSGADSMRRMDVSVGGLDVARSRVQSLFIDRQGNLWAGCQQKGLLMLPLRHQPLFTTWSFSAQHHETGTGVTAIAPAERDDVWCTVAGDGVYGFDGNGRIASHPAVPAGAETMLRTADGRYWLGTTDALWSYNPATGTAERRAAIDGGVVNVLCELPGNFLAVSGFGAGLWIYDMKGNRMVRHLTMHDTDTLGRGRLANDWIYAFDTDAQGRLWIATSSGVCCYDPVANSFATEGWRVLADREKCSALAVLSSGDVLFACEQGLFRWTEKKGLQPESGTQPLRGKAVACILEDDKHEVWMSTDEGIWQWAPDSILVAYVADYGQHQCEFVQGSGLRGNNGRLYFGVADGIVSFNPDCLRAAQAVEQRVHLTAFVVDEEAVNTLTLSGGRAVMCSPAADCHSFSLSYLDASFHMEFSLLDFITARGISFEYRMQGDDRWQQTAKGENTITFSHLSPGTYNLEVRAHSAGVSTPVETYIIEVRPPWWKTTLAYGIYILLLLAAAAACAYAYQRHIQHQLNREKLHFLMGSINNQDMPLTLDDMKRAINSFVQSRKRQRSIYGNTAAMADRMDQPEVQGNDEALMERIVQSVNRHLDDSEFSVEQLCTEAGISRAHLHRKMKEMTGMPVTEFIRNIRLEQAARLLREHKLNITQVAYSVGFSNLGYFSTVFRKHFGVSPRDFAEKEG